MRKNGADLANIASLYPSISKTHRIADMSFLLSEAVVYIEVIIWKVIYNLTNPDTCNISDHTKV